jgi:hypothetical protein
LAPAAAVVPRAPQQRVDARDELLGREGLREVIVRPRPEGLRLVGELALGGEHDHRHGTDGAHVLEDLKPVEPRHHKVEDQHVGLGV